jgi:hypothetical protein
MITRRSWRRKRFVPIRGMYLQPSGSGTKYQGLNETFWEHQGEASITWGYGTPQMRCKKAP